MVRIQRHKARHDGAGRIAVQLLIGDGAHQRLIRLTRFRLIAIGANPLDMGAKDRIGGGEVFDGNAHGGRVSPKRDHRQPHQQGRQRDWPGQPPDFALGRTMPGDRRGHRGNLW